MLLRLRDIILSFLLLFVFAIPMLFIGIYLFFIFKERLFFNHVRIGKNQQEITIFKFRTMKVDDKKVSPSFTEINDDRIVRFGHFLRKHRLDELPQLFNVIGGNLTLVGPRPEQKFFSSQFLEKFKSYHKRYQVKPGLTGLAQVSIGYVSSESGTKDKLKMDLLYIRNKSFCLDMKILIKTILIMVSGQGSR